MTRHEEIKYTLSLEPMQQRERETKRNPTRSEYNAYTAWTKKKYMQPVTIRATEAPVTPRFINANEGDK